MSASPGAKPVTEKILVVRNDKLGDFVLALPAFQLLRRALPAAELWALVPEYTREIAEMCPAISKILIDPGENEDGGSALALSRTIREQQFDAAIVLFTTPRVGIALWAARVSYRLTPATKVAQVFYNQRLTQRRSRSIKPEFEYNLDLVHHYLQNRDADFEQQLERPVIRIDSATVSLRRREMAEALNIDPDATWIFVHPGHGGSANNLTLEQYAQLINALDLGPRHVAVVNAGPGEEAAAQELVRLLACPVKAVYTSSKGLRHFVESLTSAALFISGSTGTLHLAGALNLRTAAFYPRRKTGSALRWQTLNEPSKRVAFMPPDAAEERDVGAIDVAEAADVIRRTFRSVVAP